MSAKSIVLYVFVAGLYHVVIGREVECLDDVQLDKLRQEIPNLTGVDLSCTGNRWRPNHETSPNRRAQRPESAHVSYYVYRETSRRTQTEGSDGSNSASPMTTRLLPRKPKHVGIRIEWSNKVTQLRDITGYQIIIHLPMQDFAFNIYFNVNSTANNLQGDEVNFVYKYTCEDDQCVELEQKASYVIAIMSLPGDYDVNDDTGVFEILHMPSCVNKRIRRTNICSRRRKHQDQSVRNNRTVDTTTTSPVYPNNLTTTSFSSNITSSGGIGLTSFSITLGGIVFSIAFIGWLTWGLNVKIGTKKRILFLEKISEDLDNPCSYAFQNLIYEIRKHDLAEVTYNRWETVKLIPDPIMWITKATTEADIIIALASPQDGSGENLQSIYFNEWINSLIRNRGDETIGKNIVLVSFHLKKQDSWPDFCDGANLSKYKLPEDIKKMYEAIFTTGPLKCPFNTDEMTLLANEATMRPKSKGNKATRIVRTLLKYKDEECPVSLT